MSNLMTPEQSAVVRCNAPVIVVSAFAGTGKTSTLVEYAKARPNEQFLYLAYNRALREEAQDKFPANVKCQTAHGMAWSVMARIYQRKTIDNLKPPTVSERTGWPMRTSWLALEALKRFMYSADMEIGDQHLTPGQADTRNVVEASRQLWARVRDPNDLDMPIPHDGYLKAFHLEHGQAQIRRRILFDEAQDANAVIAAIVQAQQANKLVVGDEYQAIYAWRGAINAMRMFRADAALSLTQSFRYGDDVARLATKLLSDWRGCDHRIRGTTSQTAFVVNRNAPHAVLFRTNAGMIGHGLSIMLQGVPYGFAGGVDMQRIEYVRDIWRLSINRPDLVKNETLRGFGGYSVFSAYAKEMGDGEDLLGIKLVDEYGGSLSSLIDRLLHQACNLAEVDSDSVVSLSTAHKAKGLEFDHVVLHDDFDDLVVRTNPQTGALEGPDPQSIHLHYVAMTRAKKSLQLSSQLSTGLNHSPPEDHISAVRRANIFQAPAHKTVRAQACAAPHPPAVLDEQKAARPVKKKPGPEDQMSLFDSMPAPSMRRVA